MSYEEIIHFLSRKYKIAERDCERIVDSQFKVLQETIQNRELKVVNIIKLGKFTPNQRIMKNKEEYEARAKKYKDEGYPDRSNYRRKSKETIQDPSNERGTEV